MFSPFDEDLAAVGPQQADEVFEKHALPPARTSDDDRRLPAGDRQVDAAEDLLRAEALGQAANAEEGRREASAFILHPFC